MKRIVALLITLHFVLLSFPHLALADEVFEFESYKDLMAYFEGLGYTEAAWDTGLREVNRVYLSNMPSRWLSDLALRYKVFDSPESDVGPAQLEELLTRVDIIPPSLVMAKPLKKVAGVHHVLQIRAMPCLVNGPGVRMPSSVSSNVPARATTALRPLITCKIQLTVI